MHKTLVSRMIGFVLSLILTLTAFLVIFRPDFFPMGMRVTITVLLILAVLQFIVQSICFLNVWGEKGPRWNLLIFVSTISVVVIIVVFTIWVMGHLNYNMMYNAYYRFDSGSVSVGLCCIIPNRIRFERGKGRRFPSLFNKNERGYILPPPRSILKKEKKYDIKCGNNSRSYF